MFRNIVSSLIQYERIETTLPKAKDLRRIADKMITLGKQGDMNAKKQALSYLKVRTLSYLPELGVIKRVKLPSVRDLTCLSSQQTPLVVSAFSLPLSAFSLPLSLPFPSHCLCLLLSP